MHQKPLKITKLKLVSSDRIGKIIKNGIRTELAEEKTLKCLTRFGFNIELIRPTSIEKSNNPDALILGTIWEIKSPESSNPNTIKNRLRKAAKQANNIIFDLRNVKRGAVKVKKQIIDFAQEGGKVNHIMIIEKDDTVLDIKRQKRYYKFNGSDPVLN
ncbi:hypothetical protein IJH29_02150 [Candidatus Saccharibacteria bacterium]|nr:hypothetical protein [Candidatus Saccharibacteria bacterium]